MRLTPAGALRASDEQLMPHEVIGTFDYKLFPGIFSPRNLTYFSKILIESNKSSLRGEDAAGIWLVREDELVATDEFGWLCIYWPAYLKHVVWHRDTFNYLKNRVGSVRSLKKIALQDFEGAVEAIRSYQHALSQALPPGCVLAADNAFFRRIVGLKIPAENYSDFANSPLRANLDHWSFIRFGALAKTYPAKGPKWRTSGFSELLQRYSATRDVLIGKALENAPDGTPTLVKALLIALREARYCDGAAWQKWGVAWVKDGLVFNYRQAINSMRMDSKLYNSVFGNSSVDSSPNWLDPSYGAQRPPPGLPRLDLICKNSDDARRRSNKALIPYEMLFSDSELDIAARANDHKTEFQVFFPISRLPSKDLEPKDILAYIERLAHYNDERLPLPTNEFRKNAALQLVKETKVAKKSKKDDKAHPLFGDNKPDLDFIEDDPTQTMDRVLYSVGFNGYNLGCTLESPVGPSSYPFSFGMVEYRGDNYFSLPDEIIRACPEIINRVFYDKDIKTATITWHPDGHNGWKTDIYAKSPRDLAHILEDQFVGITLAHTDNYKRPLYHSWQGSRYLHPRVFRKGGEFDAVVAALLEHKPDLRPEHVDLIKTYQTLWSWIYDIRTVLKQGKVTGEFMYTIGLDTTHCPKDKRLDVPAKRLQYIIDKAMHSRDERVCDIEPSSNPHAKRSKKMNSYDEFVLWYVAHHEIAELPWKLDVLQQATYVSKRWLPWRRALGLIPRLVKPHKEGTQDLASAFKYNPMPHVLKYAKDMFGTAFTDY